MRKLLLTLVIMGVVAAAHASSSDAIELFISAGNSISVSVTGKIFRLNMTSGAVTYDTLGRVVQVGDVTVVYDELSRAAQIGSISIAYDMSSRIIQIGNVAISYDNSNRIAQIGTGTIAYDELSRVKNITGITGNVRFAFVPGRS